ncbi:GPI biosynthesis protein Pig-F [Phytophthora cactorum]|nr:GPI biosynthesis protein Pig-F [Phytophthora cactorum]
MKFIAGGFSSIGSGLKPAGHRFSLVNAIVWDVSGNATSSSPCLVMIPKSLQLVLPGAFARYLPVLLFGQHLEDAVLSGLVPVVAAIVGLLLALNLMILRSPDHPLFKQILGGILGLSVDADIVARCIALELCDDALRSAFGCAPRKWLDLLLELNVSNSQDLYLVCSSIGAMLGAYVGALPIPLDWDRPWQQWPLTCVYGTLMGHAAGIFSTKKD